MTRVDELARSAVRLVEAARLGVRAFTPIDTNRVPAEWRHVTKIDPEDEKRLPLLYPRYLGHTSAVSVGGSRDVTAENTAETFELLSGLSVPAFHEPSGPRHVSERTRELAAFLAVPEVLNGDVESLIGKLGEGAEYIRDELAPALIEEKLPWLPTFLERRVADFAAGWMLAEAVFEAYIIQNPDSAAARESGVTPDDCLSPREAVRRAMAAEKHLDSDVIYLEYSGTFGGDEATAILDAVSEAVSWSRVWYGGGLDSRENVRTVLDAGADAVVVGDIFHDIADEEVSLCADAVDELPLDASDEQVDEWVAARSDPAETSAGKYLSTIPGAHDSAALAGEYLTATVRTRLALEALAEECEVDEGTDLAEIRAGIAGRGSDALEAPSNSRDTDDADDSDGADDSDDPDDPDASDGLGIVQATRQIESALGDDETDLAYEYAIAFLADRAGIEHEPGLPLAHVIIF